MITDEEAQKWFNTIRYADWSYDRSDDYGAYSRGKARCEQIYRQGKESNLTEEDKQKIINLIIKEYSKYPDSMNYFIDRVNYIFRGE